MSVYNNYLEVKIILKGPFGERLSVIGNWEVVTGECALLGGS